MLRNDDGADAVRGFVLLNEVLSLNAQESAPRGMVQVLLQILNEVLSLNAQECVQAIDTSLVFDPQ